MQDCALPGGPGNLNERTLLEAKERKKKIIKELVRHTEAHPGAGEGGATKCYRPLKVPEDS